MVACVLKPTLIILTLPKTFGVRVIPVVKLPQKFVIMPYEERQYKDYWQQER